MASESYVSETSSLFETLFTFRDLSFFLPFILGFSTDSSSSQETTNSSPIGEGERVILINPFTQGMVLIDGNSSLETMFQDIGMKNGLPPASKESIDAMPSVKIGEQEEGGGECVICLEEWEVGRVVKEMPCKHRFHQDCIEKWLGIHGSCPVCRYQMPVDEKEEGKRDEESREIWVSFLFRSENSSQDLSDNSSGNSLSSRGDFEVEN